MSRCASRKRHRRAVSESHRENLEVLTGESQLAIKAPSLAMHTFYRAALASFRTLVSRQSCLVPASRTTPGVVSRHRLGLGCTSCAQPEHRHRYTSTLRTRRLLCRRRFAPRPRVQVEYQINFESAEPLPSSSVLAVPVYPDHRAELVRTIRPGKYTSALRSSLFHSLASSFIPLRLRHRDPSLCLSPRMLKVLRHYRFRM